MSKINKSNKWLILGILNFIYSTLTVSFALFSKLILDNAQEANTKEVIFYSIIFLIVVASSVLFKFFQNLLYVKFMVEREHELKDILFTNVISKANNQTHTSLLLQSYTSDVDNIIVGELEIIPRCFQEISRLLLATIMLVVIDYKVLLCFGVLCLFGLGLVRIYSKKMKKLHAKVLDADGSLNSFFTESASNTKMILAYDAIDNFKSYYKNKETVSKLAKTKKYNLQVFANNFLILGSNIIVCIVVFYGGYQISIGLMTYGSLMAIMQLFNHIQAPILNVSGLINRFSLYKTSVKRFEEKLKGDIVTVDKNKDFDSIILDNVSFGYNDNLIFKNLTFEINKNEVIRISGESGIGKTTLFNLLLGVLKPNSGEISIVRGSKTLPLKNSSLFSYVSQESILFSGSIKDNFMLLVGSTDKMEEALKFSNLYDEIINMPNGFDTILNEGGKGLSIGQLQRLIIALSYCLDREIFLLDEFTSSLDCLNSETIINNLKKLNKTIIYISHKNESLIPDKVIDLSKYK